MPDLSPRQQLVRTYLADRPLAHRVLFAHRHPQGEAPFHPQMITDFHSSIPYLLDLVFREGAKSTLAEEAILLMALFREYKNCLIISSNGPLAQERLHAIRHEALTNEDLHRLFLRDAGMPVESDAELVFNNGTRIVARGRGQSLRGTKFEDQRPDLIFIDDMEGEQADVATPEARAKNMKWFTSDLLPAGDSRIKRVRMAATLMHPESVPARLQRDPDWVVHKFPLYYLDDEGEKQSAWPARRSIEDIVKLEDGYRARGQIDEFNQEYMCEAETPESKLFKAEMIFVQPRIRTWEAVYSMTDPARTTTSKAATTGRVIWSWIGAKLIIWDAIARRWMPDAIIDDLFWIWENYHPVYEGFEEDGLNQWALQSIRQEMVKRGVTIPLKAMKAPNSKLSFIGGLQPFFVAREVEFAKPLPDLKGQLLGFPTGDIDAPNALAYALKMRPGAPMYDEFGGRHVAEDLAFAQGRPVWLCLNATRGCVTGVLCQAFDGQVRILGDAVREGEVATACRDILDWAKLEVGATGDVRPTGGPLHFDHYNNVGLRQALSRVPTDLRQSAAPDRGRPYVRSLLQRDIRGAAALQVSDKATWTLNALAGGYARNLKKGGALDDYAEDGVYRVLIEGLESFLGLLEYGSPDAQGSARFNAETAQGRPFRSMVAGDVNIRGTKADWGDLLKGGRG
jgi:hypothetical protein